MCGAGHEAPVPDWQDSALALGVMDDGGRIVLGPATRELRRALQPIEWVVLEDVALDARRDDAGALVATTSARRVAEHLGLTPGAVARALARLRSAGLVSHTRQAGPAGRFGLSAYVLGTVPGLDVLPAAPEGDGSRPARPGPALPCLPAPRPAPPHVDPPGAVDAHMVGAEAAGGQGLDDAGSARPALHNDAAAARAAAVADLASEGSARSTGSGAPARPRQRPASKAAATQLSILDANAVAELEPNPEPQPSPPSTTSRPR